jgi:hypothetical protein
LNRKSPSCTSGKTGHPLTEYDSKTEAKSGARYANQNYSGNNLVPYKCDRCGFWHLTPTERQTPSETCSVCRGADGKQKEAYQSKDDAEQRATLLRKEQGVSLTVYKCEHGNGWHLTKNKII